jgi:predicted dehydrogenase
MTLDPGHFHAALFQREMLPGMAQEAFVYAPLGPDLAAHLKRVAAFNSRSDRPTHWHLQVYTGRDYLERMLRERPGQIVILSGRNQGKIDRLLACVRAGLHVLADKPWILEEKDLPKLQEALETTETRRVIAYDAMTQRFEVTALLLRALVNDPEVFGGLSTGSLAQPAVTVESLHYLLKEVAGAPNLRPPWFFDITQQGEGLTDVGTHLVDMVQWVMCPDQVIDYRSDIEVHQGRRWPTLLTLDEFRRVTGEEAFPESLQETIRDGKLEYFCNNAVDYSLRGVPVRVETTWEFVAPPGQKDAERVVFRGERARIEVLQTAEGQYRREMRVVPNQEAQRRAVFTALKRRLSLLETDWPGLEAEEQGDGFRVVIPERHRLGHEEHFALLAQRFLDYVRHPRSLPAGEKSNLLAKYYVTTRGVALARQTAAK